MCTLHVCKVFFCLDWCQKYKDQKYKVRLDHHRRSIWKIQRVKDYHAAFKQILEYPARICPEKKLILVSCVWCVILTMCVMLCVCVCVCDDCACVCVCMRGCVCMCLCVSVFVSECVYEYVCLCARTFVSLCVCAYKYVREQV